MDIVKPYRIDLESASSMAIIVCGLWCRAAFVGACVAVGALGMLSVGDAAAVVAVPTAIAGGALALFAFQRARVALERVDEKTSKPSVSTMREPDDFLVELPLSR